VKTTLDILIARDHHCVGKDQLPTRCWGGLSPHHIVNRGMGGSKLHDGPEWTILMCAGHNAAMESDSETAKIARALGFKIRRNGKIPDHAKVHYLDGWFYLIGALRVEAAHDA
jgi:hypothetical protein